MALRQGVEAQAALPDAAFDARIPAAGHRFSRHDRRGLCQSFPHRCAVGSSKVAPAAGHYAGVNVFRLKQSLREHLNILDHLENRQYEVAADLLRIHLRLSRSQRSQAASRGAPALFGMISRPD
ncbi:MULTISPECIES: hypothetical protein [unclassified Mesorhizobium]|uniref:hypothetical protein n=1 Tax=unclassified Mesorhizobium TaxID=325217 RepID=UPI001FEEA863|nr:MULTISPECIES: hypothetical protein [unclassified Mesorhizobium]